MIHEDFRLNLEHLEPCLDLSGLGYDGPYPVELYLIDEAQQLVLQHHFHQPPLRIIHPKLERGHYHYRIQQKGRCLQEGEVGFP